MDVSDLRTLSVDDIRARHDRDALDPESARVEDPVLSSPQELGDLSVATPVA